MITVTEMHLKREAKVLKYTMETKDSKKYNAYKDLSTEDLFELLTVKNKRAFKVLTERLKEVINGLIRASAHLKDEGSSFSFKWDNGSKVETHHVTRKDIRAGFTAVNETLLLLNTVYATASKKSKKEVSPLDQKGHFTPLVVTDALRNFFATSLSPDEAGGLPNLLTKARGLLATARDTFYYIATTKGMKSQMQGEGDVLIPNAQLTALLNSRPKYMYEDTGRLNSKGKPILRKVPASPDVTTADAIQRVYGNKPVDSKGKNKSFNRSRMRMFYLLVIISMHSDSGSKLSEAELRAFKSLANLYAQEYETIVSFDAQVNAEAASKKASAKAIERQQTATRTALLNDIERKEAAFKATVKATKKSA